MKVLKFGTTALANADKIRLVARIVKESDSAIVILSAMTNTTTLLEEISDYLYKKNLEGANEVINRLDNDFSSLIEELFADKSLKKQAYNLIAEKIDFIRSFSKDLFTLFEEKIILAQGEILSSGLFTLLIREFDLKVTELSALDFMRIDKKLEPNINYIQNHIQQLLLNNKDSNLFITQGYICRNAYNEVDNFKFGGSDYTASLIGAAINASEIQIWTDIDSFYGDNTELISNTETVHHINFDEAAELAYFGVKILHPICILPAKISNIPVRLLNIYKPTAEGVVISDHTEAHKIKAIASKDNITALNIKSSMMLFAQGFLRKVCEVFEKHQTSIDMLTTSEVGISITIDNTHYLDEITNDLKKQGIVTIDKQMTLICIIGDFDEKPDFRSLVFDSIKNVPIRMISYGGSHNNLSFLIDQKYKNETLQILKDKLFNNKK